MQQKKTQRYTACFVLLSVLLFALIVLNISAGSTLISPGRVLNAVFLRGDRTTVNIIWNIRMPRLAAALVLGGALSVSGFLLQTFFANPIAGPFVLGISSSAKLAVALTMIFCLGQGIVIQSFAMVAAAFIGAMLAMGAVLLASRKLRGMSLLIVCGVMIGYICTAITDFAVTFADDSDIVNLHNWSLGSFSGISWGDVHIAAEIVAVSVIFAFLLSKPMSAYQMGEEYARTLGVDIKKFRLELILVSSVLSACVTAFAGPISFVGIAVPQLIKGLFRTSKPVIIIPACFLGGAVFCLFCDLLARTLFAPSELSISSVTALFGVPVVIFMLFKRRSREA